jgi:phosphoserine aminotransferase
VYKWLLEEGGISVIETRNTEKAKTIYDLVESSKGFYRFT